MIRFADKDELNIWDDTLANQGGYPYQSRLWALHKERAGGFRALFLIFEFLGEKYPFLVLQKKAFLFGSIGYCPKGPIISAQEETIWQEFTRQVKAFFRQNRCLDILIIEPPVEENGEILINCGWLKSKRDIQPKATIWVNLNKSESALLESFSPKMRYNIRLAQRKGLKTVLARGDKNDFTLLFSLLEETSRRAGFTIRKKTEYFDYWQNFIEANWGKILFVSHGNQTLCGLFMIIFGEKAYYKDGGSSNAGRSLMAPHLLQFEAMKLAQAHNCLEYDLVGVPPKDSPANHPFAGLLRFKQGFNRTITEYVGCYDLIIAPKGIFWHRYQLRYNGLIHRLGFNDFY